MCCMKYSLLCALLLAGCAVSHPMMPVVDMQDVDPAQLSRDQAACEYERQHPPSIWTVQFHDCLRRKGYKILIEND